MQTFLHGKIACPQAAEWDVLFPRGVICLSRSTLNGLPSPASKSFLCELVLSTLPWFFPFSSAKRLFSRCLLCSLLNHSLLNYNYPGILYIWNTFHFHAAANERARSAGQEFSWCLQETQHKLAQKDSFLPCGLQHSPGHSLLAFPHRSGYLLPLQH